MSTIREQYEELECRILSERAVLACKSKGRLRDEPKCDIRTDFQRDRDRIIHSKSFRRLKHKTQVFIDPEEDHFRTRLTHTLEVAQIARTIARALRLNEDLTEAIALGHDLGHTPFGHAGESALDEVIKEYVPEAGFKHSVQSLRVVDTLEKKGTGLNLTYEVRDGILHHSKGSADLSVDSKGPATLEGRIVRISDRVAYINHDIDDAIRAGLISQQILPVSAIKVLGDTHSQRIGTMVKDIIKYSTEHNAIGMSESVRKATDQLKDFLYKEVYELDKHELVEMGNAGNVLKDLFRYYMDNDDKFAEMLHEDLSILKHNVYCVNIRVLLACDFISGMTDRYAQKEFERLFQK